MSDQYESTGYDDLWLWFGMSRSTFCVLPRVMMHDMPDDWQKRMAELLDEWNDTWKSQPEIGTRIQITSIDGKLIKTPDWLLNYRYPDRDQLAAMKQSKAMLAAAQEVES